MTSHDVVVPGDLAESWRMDDISDTSSQIGSIPEEVLEYAKSWQTEEEGMEEDADCPICLDPMTTEDHQHVLQCQHHCGYNFCHECIESLIASSKDGTKNECRCLFVVDPIS